MSIITLADHTRRTRSVHHASAGSIPVDVLVEGALAERRAKHLLSRLLLTLPKTPVLHDEALLDAGRAADDLIAGIVDDHSSFVSVSIGRRFDETSGDSEGVVMVRHIDDCVAVPSIVVVARGTHIVGVATAVGSPAGPDSLASATVSSSRCGLSAVLARHILGFGIRSAEPLLRMSDASGLAVSAAGCVLPC